MVLKAPTWKCKFSLKCRTHSKNTELKPRDLVVSSTLGLDYFNDLLREHNIEKEDSWHYDHVSFHAKKYY